MKISVVIFLAIVQYALAMSLPAEESNDRVERGSHGGHEHGHGHGGHGHGNGHMRRSVTDQEEEQVGVEREERGSHGGHGNGHGNGHGHGHGHSRRSVMEEQEQIKRGLTVEEDKERVERGNENHGKHEYNGHGGINIPT